MLRCGGVKCLHPLENEQNKSPKKRAKCLIFVRLLGKGFPEFSVFLLGPLFEGPKPVAPNHGGHEPTYQRFLTLRNKGFFTAGLIEIQYRMG